MAKVTSGLVYKILSSVNQWVLDVHDGTPNDRILIIPYKWSGRDNQIWVAEKVEEDENVFIFASLANAKYVMDNSEREEGRLLTFSKHGRKNQQWRIEPIHSGSFDCYIQNVADGKVLELTRDGRDLRLTVKDPSNVHQRWIFSEAQ